MHRLKFVSMAVACGGLAACLYVAATFGTPGALLLVYMTQLPLFVAGLWLGTGGAAIAGLTGAVLLLLVSDALGAGIFLGLDAVPVVVLVRQALLARRQPDGTFAWYPPGLLTAWLTATALVGLAAALLLFGGPAGLQAAVRVVVGDVLSRMPNAAALDRGNIVAALAAITPGIVAASWMATAIVNAVLAQGVLARFGANWRPSPDLVGLSLPIWLPAALALSAAATFFPGAPRFVGVNVMLALSVPFCLAGLAVLHAAARRMAQPAVALVCFYTVAALFGWPFLMIAVLGLLESWLGLRRRLAPPSS
jgi:hypothetical protein